MSDAREGGCQCGRVRYRFTGDPIALTICHCTECQRQSGSAFGMSLLVPRERLELSGELASFERPTDSGRTIRCSFCPDCGVRIHHEPPYAPEVFNIKAGTLDDTSDLVPKLHVWTKRKQPWFEPPEGVRCFEDQPF